MEEKEGKINATDFALGGIASVMKQSINDIGVQVDSKGTVFFVIGF